MFQKGNLLAEEKSLAEAALGDSATYRFLSLKNQVALEEGLNAIALSQVAMAKSLGGKLSKISSKAGITVAGMAAAWHLGEEMPEGFGEDWFSRT